MVQVTIDECISKKLTQSSDDHFGLLYGLINQQNVFILGCAKCNSLTGVTSPDWKLCLKKIQPFLPGGISVCGIFLAKGNNDQTLTETCKKNLKLLVDTKLVDNSELLVGIVVDGKSEIDKVMIHNSDQRIAVDTQFKLVEHLQDKLLNFRIKVDIPVYFSPYNKESIEREVSRLRQIVTSQRNCYFIRDWQLMLSCNSDATCDSAKTCRDFIKNQPKSADNPSLKRIDVELLQKTTDRSLNLHSPILDCEVLLSNNCKLHEIMLSIEILVLYFRDTGVKHLAKLFTDAILIQLDEVKNLLQDNNRNPNHAIPEVFQYVLPDSNCPIMVMYPNLQINGELVAEETLEDYRRHLHMMFCLPDNKPLLKRANSYQYRSQFKDGHLVNTHEGLSMPKGDGTQIALVDGCYSYFHYMQDNINDDQWGCAYRSFQTLYSWFRYQGYTDKATPMHKDIQQALCDVGDKPSTFVGSKKWIGSYEVSICLDHFLNVSSRIVCVSSGVELPQKARELVSHFQSEGTPIMIGGGVLAHTILGISFNEITGEVKFLILDPHYTGRDDLKTIHSKGWCGWKGPNFWDQRANYNLCLPMTPSMV